MTAVITIYLYKGSAQYYQEAIEKTVTGSNQLPAMY